MINFTGRTSRQPGRLAVFGLVFPLVALLLVPYFHHHHSAERSPGTHFSGHVAHVKDTCLLCLSAHTIPAIITKALIRIIPRIQRAEPASIFRVSFEQILPSRGRSPPL
ncbi:MAG TPA: hypothetical protein PK014_08330 [Thermoanaerobaculia bacterium]|nr:hypothetical protein [Thermoanaerobaculia bacterium]HUM30165.1 hypothetical protein [Thermoanaerobaculia bacterium]HXK68386.1 hypothetical protein [Thermoanaerobaculia bacterium]